MEFLRFQLQVRHCNWPYLIQLFTAFLLFGMIGYFLFEGSLFLAFLILEAFVFISLTQFHLYNLQKMEEANSRYKVQALQEIMSLLPLRAPLPPMTGWAATPELALNVMRTIQIEKPDLIVELGSGVTSIISSYTLEKYYPTGRIISFDHDEKYASITRNEIGIHDLGDFADVIDVNLTGMEIEGELYDWYEIKQEYIRKPIDLLVIDGPPLKTRPNARYPALPMLFKSLSDRATIILHDSTRNMESSTTDRWMNDFPELKKVILQTEKGITIFKRTPADSSGSGG